MKAVVLLAILAWQVPFSRVIAQDLVITNGRVLDGTGRTIEGGTVVVAGGRIVTVSDQAVDTDGAVVIDVQGMTVLPGLIDTHRHDLLGDLNNFAKLADEADVASAIDRETPRKLRKLLEEGFTTVMMPGTYLSASLEVRRRLAEGELQGPRLLFSGPGFCAPGDFPVKGMVCQGNPFCEERVAFEVADREEARQHVRSLAEAKVDGIKVLVDDKGSDLDDAVLAAINTEAQLHGLPRMLHAHRVADMLDGVRLGSNRLVHTPGDSLIAEGPGAGLLADANAYIATTVSFTSPQFAAAAGFESDVERHQRILDNVRHLVDSGVVVAFGTDSPDFIRPLVEVQELSRVLQPAEIIACMTRDAARFLDLENELGTLEPGKIADITIIAGNPLENLSDLAQVAFVIQGGRIVVDNH